MLSRKKKGPRKIVGPTHNVSYSKDGDFARQTQAWGKADLYKLLSEMMRDGFTEFHINTINYQ